MSEEKTPGQVAYEAMHASRIKRGGNTPGDSFTPWDELDETWHGEVRREDFDAAAQAVLGSRTPWGDVNVVTIEEHRWYAVVRNGGPDGDVIKVIGYRGDSGISYHDSVADWEAASQ